MKMEELSVLIGRWREELKERQRQEIPEEMGDERALWGESRMSTSELGFIPKRPEGMYVMPVHYVSVHLLTYAFIIIIIKY